MYFKIFNIPIPDSEGELERLNKFVSGVRVISVRKEVAVTGGISYWSFVIEYYRENNTGERSETRKNRIDYREVLAEEDFAVYSALRDVWKKLAEQEGVPVYTIATNEQLAEIVTKKTITKNKMSEIQGMGEKKLEKYGGHFIEKMKEIYEKDRKPLQ